MIYVKAIISWTSKNRKTILQFIILISCILLPTILLIPAGKPKIIASLISLILNGKINDDLQAQILIENLTTHEMEENVELLDLIESDMTLLTNQILGLDKINIYNYSSTSLPGQINMLLENIRFRERKYLKEINSIIESDRDKWWYIDEFIFTSILEEVSIVDAYDFHYCGQYATFNLLSFESPQRYYDNVTLQSNETIIASYWIIEDGNWTINEEFVNVINNEIFSLSEKIAGIEEISNPYQKVIETRFNETWINLEYPVLYNLTEPIPFSYAEFFGEIYIRIVFSKDASRTERNAASKTFVRIVLSRWYVQDYFTIGPCDFGEDMIRVLIGGAIALSVSFPIFLIVTIRLAREIRKRKKARS